MVVVILSGNIARQPGYDHLGSREAHEPHNLLERVAVMPGFERPQHVLTWRVRRADEPDIHHTKRSKRAAGFDFANRSQ